MLMDSPMLSPCDGDPCKSTPLSAALSLSDDTSGGLTDIVNVGEGSSTFDEHWEHFSSATINSRFLDSH